MLLDAAEPDEFDGAFAAMAKGRVEALFVFGDPMFNVHRVRLADLAVRHRLPTMYTNRPHERADGDRVIAHGKTYGFAPYVELGVEPGEWDSSIVVKNGRIVYYEWYYTPEFNTRLERACLQKPDYVIAGKRCLVFTADAKARTESVGRK